MVLTNLKKAFPKRRWPGLYKAGRLALGTGRQIAAFIGKPVAQYQKRMLFKTMQDKHAALLQQKYGKPCLRVVFIVIHKSVWKVDPVFRRMQSDARFDPVILVAPFTRYGPEIMNADMDAALNYFEKKGYPVVAAGHPDSIHDFVTLESLSPDIVFPTNPHKLTTPEPTSPR